MKKCIKDGGNTADFRMLGVSMNISLGKQSRPIVEQYITIERLKCLKAIKRDGKG